jgi:hypothetical protein
MPGLKYIVRLCKGFWDAQSETAPGRSVEVGTGGITAVLSSTPVLVAIKARGTKTPVPLLVKKTFAEVEIWVFDQFGNHRKGRARNGRRRAAAAAAAAAATTHH